MEIRIARPGEASLLSPLWEGGFGDGADFAALFAQKAFVPENHLLLFEDGAAVSMTAIFPCALVDAAGRAEPAGCIYGLCTLPGQRGLGYAEALLNAAEEQMRRRGMRRTILHPASDSLFDWYARRGFCTAFTVQEACFRADAAEGSLRVLEAGEYASLREELLRGLCHVAYSPRLCDFQREINRQAGGGLFGMRLPGGLCCASAAVDEAGALRAGGLLGPPELLPQAAALLCARMQKPLLYARTPFGQTPFGMNRGPALAQPGYLGLDFC